MIPNTFTTVVCRWWIRRRAPSGCRRGSWDRGGGQSCACPLKHVIVKSIVRIFTGQCELSFLRVWELFCGILLDDNLPNLIRGQSLLLL